MPILAFGPEGEYTPDSKAIEAIVGSVSHDENQRGWMKMDIGEIRPVYFGERSEVWVHGVMKRTDGSSTTSSIDSYDETFVIKDDQGNILFGVSGRSYSFSGNAYMLRGVNSDTDSIQTLWEFSQSTFAPEPLGEIVWDLHILIQGDTVTFTAYQDGSLFYTLTFNAPVSSRQWGLPSQVSVSSFFHTDNTSTNIQETCRLYWRDIVVGDADTPTLGFESVVLEATAAGFHTDGQGAYTAIDQPGVDMSETVVLSAAGDKISWTVNFLSSKNLGGSPGSLIFTVIAKTESGSAITGYRPFVRIGGTDYPASETLPVTNQFEQLTYEFSNNPATGEAWEPADISSGIEIGLEAMSA